LPNKSLDSFIFGMLKLFYFYIKGESSHSYHGIYLLIIYHCRCCKKKAP
jgi:hypothetical protein